MNIIHGGDDTTTGVYDDVCGFGELPTVYVADVFVCVCFLYASPK